MRATVQFAIWVFAAAALAVTACTPVPRAFAPGEVDSVGNAIVHGTFTKGIQVNPVEGTAPIMSKILARTTADSFEPYGLPAGVAPFDASEYILHGRAHRDKNPNAIPYVTIHWQLSNKDGLLLADLEQPVDATSGEWEFGTPEVIIRVAEDVAHRVAAILAGIAPAQAEPAPDKGIFVMPVEGAPGDGDFSLTRAIAEALKVRGTRLRNTFSTERWRSRPRFRAARACASPGACPAPTARKWARPNRTTPCRRAPSMSNGCRPRG